MTSINLLPKVKPVERLFIPLLVIVILFSISFAVLIAYWFVRTETQVVDSRAQVSQLEVQIKLLNKQQETDSITKDYQLLHSEAKKLADARQDWLSVINQLTSVLPLNSRILSVGVTDDEKISLVLESFRMEDIANYIVLLDRSGKFSGVTASSFNMKLFTKPTIVSQTIPVEETKR
jgi:Tfp pilus assembly protein PilN